MSNTEEKSDSWSYWHLPFPQQVPLLTRQGLFHYGPRNEPAPLRQLFKRAQAQAIRLFDNGVYAVPRVLVTRKKGQLDKHVLKQKVPYKKRARSCGHPHCRAGVDGEGKHVPAPEQHAAFVRKDTFLRSVRVGMPRKEALLEASLAATDCLRRHQDQQGTRQSWYDHVRGFAKGWGWEEGQSPKRGEGRSGWWEYHRGAYSYSLYGERRFEVNFFGIDHDGGVWKKGKVNTEIVKTPEEDRRALAQFFQSHGLRGYFANTSHSGGLLRDKGIGVHDRCLIDGGLPSWFAHKLGKEITRHVLRDRPYVDDIEVFPKSHEFSDNWAIDRKTAKVKAPSGDSHLLNAPLAAHLHHLGKASLIDPSTGRPFVYYDDSVAYAESIQGDSVEKLCMIANMLGFDINDPWNALKDEPNVDLERLWETRPVHEIQGKENPYLGSRLKQKTLTVPLKGEKRSGQKRVIDMGQEDPLAQALHEAGVDALEVCKAAGTELKKVGERWTGCCPVHKGTNPTQFNVFPARDGVLAAKCLSPDCADEHPHGWKNPIALHQAVHGCSWGESRDAVAAMAGIENPRDEKWQRKSRFQEKYASQWKNVYEWVGKRVGELPRGKYHKFLQAMVNALDRLNQEEQVIDPEEIAVSIFHHDTQLLDVKAFFDETVLPTLKKLDKQREDRKKGLSKSSGVSGIGYLRREFGAVCMNELVSAIMADTQFKLEWGRVGRAITGCAPLKYDRKGQDLVWDMHNDARHREEDLLNFTTVPTSDQAKPLDDVQIEELQEIVKIDRYISRQAGRLVGCSITKEEAWNDLTGKKLWSTWKRCGSRHCTKCGLLHYSTMYKALIRKWQYHKGPIWVAETRGLTRAQVDEARAGLSDMGSIAQRVMFTGYREDGHVVTTYSATQDQAGFCASGKVVGGVDRDQEFEFKFDTIEEAAAHAVSSMFGLTAYVSDLIKGQDVQELEAELGFLKHRRLVGKTRESLGGATVEDVKAIRKEEVEALHEGDGVDENVLVGAGSKDSDMAAADEEAAGLRLDHDGDVFEIGAQISYRLITPLGNTIAVSERPFSIDRVVSFMRFNHVLKNDLALLREQENQVRSAVNQTFSWSTKAAA